MLERAEKAVRAGINLIVLLALSDGGRASYDIQAAQYIASLGCPVFACTPDHFLYLMAVALQKSDVNARASGQGIAIVRAAAR